MSSSLDFRRIPLDRVVPSTTNPRSVPPGADVAAAWNLGPLAESIRHVGVTTPIIVRNATLADGEDLYEIVAGERRWRASRMAGLDEVPAMVREMTDFEARQEQVRENHQREDLHPLEEAQGFANLLAADGRDGYASVEDLADAMSVSERHVRQRLKLLTLCEPARAALWAGSIGVGQALAIGRLPHADQQATATAHILAGWGGEPLSAKAAREYVTSTWLLRLDKAPFDIAAAWPQIDPDPGRCTTCPKRSSAEPGLFDGEEIAGDMCMDKRCWDAKAGAHHAAERTHLKASAQRAPAEPAAPPDTPAPQPEASAEPAAGVAAMAPPRMPEAQARLKTMQLSATLFGQRLFEWLHAAMGALDRDAPFFATALRLVARRLFKECSSEDGARLLYAARGWRLPATASSTWNHAWDDDFARRLAVAGVHDLVDIVIAICVAADLDGSTPPAIVQHGDIAMLTGELGLTQAAWTAMARHALEQARQDMAAELGLTKQAARKAQRNSQHAAATAATAAFVAAHRGAHAEAADDAAGEPDATAMDNQTPRQS